MIATLLLGLAACAQSEPLVPREWLLIDAVDRAGRRPFRPDAVFREHLLRPDAAPPVEGAAMQGERGEERAWTRVEAAEDGSVEARGAAWAYAALALDESEIRIAELPGAATLYVNGAAFPGDLYRYGLRGVPVALRAGRNDLYVHGVRGGFALRLHAPAAPVLVADWDATRPQLVAGEPVEVHVGVPILYASEGWSGPLSVQVEERAGRLEPSTLELRGGLAPLGVLALDLALRGPAPAAGSADLALLIVVRDAGGAELGRGELALEVRAAGELRLATYVSEVDGSVQEYALLPPAPAGGEPPPMHLVLSLHGAGVTAHRQASCYAQRPDFWLVAPMNRRPFGFDWQDWGRRDAYDVLERALARSRVPRERVHVTGHSMGGHGAWHLAANDADGFASAAPSAGWESFDSYGGRPEGARRELWHAADAASRTLELIDNLRQVPAYVLHGTDDRTVPVGEALTMIEALARADASVGAHLEGGAGHWWGNQCMDWPPIFEHFRARSIAADPPRLDFLTVDPGVDARHHWLRVEQPLAYGSPVRVRAELDAPSGRVLVTTENARSLAIARAASDFTIDGQELGVEDGDAGHERWFVREEGSWRVALGPPPAGEKRADSCGPFKRAFDRRFVLVAGTRGSAEETRALLERARADAGAWWYRGNGRAELLTDEAFLAAPAPGRNVILYGNRDTNAAWGEVLGEECPIDARRGALRLGEELLEGAGLAALFVHPRKDEEGALAGFFADTGVEATRLGHILAPFVSGVGYPDWVVFDGAILTSGDGGVRAAGWFDHRWRLAAEEPPAEEASGR